MHALKPSPWSRCICYGMLISLLLTAPVALAQPPPNPVHRIILCWNRFSYNHLKDKVMAHQNAVVRHSRNSDFEYFSFKNNLIIHPFYLCANHTVPRIHHQCIHFVSDLIKHHHPNQIISLQSAGLIGGKQQDLLKLFQIH